MSALVFKLTSNALVRGIIAPNGTHRFSVYDFITVVCQKSDKGEYARKTYSNLIKEGSEYKQEVENNECSLPTVCRRWTVEHPHHDTSWQRVILGFV